MNHSQVSDSFTTSKCWRSNESSGNVVDAFPVENSANIRNMSTSLKEL